MSKIEELQEKVDNLEERLERAENTIKRLYQIMNAQVIPIDQIHQQNESSEQKRATG